MQSELAIVVRELATGGFDPFVGRKLYWYATQAGLVDIGVQDEPYHLCAGRMPEREFELWQLKLDIALPRAAAALNDATRAIELKDRMLDYFLRPDTLSYSVIFTVAGRK